ncbi:MAG TPA: M20/M25/M40 family metallo-hydrolase [Elusimicrobiota bacterium]|nr:M20/M25/M40 family metallo-hydrolase [Elusimicrobiota bacterium]
MRPFLSDRPGRLILAAAVMLGINALSLAAAAPNWKKAQQEMTDWLRGYVRIDTSNPPGNEEQSALYLKSILDKEGISCEIFVSTPGRANLLARIPAKSASPDPALLLLHHMDVVPAQKDQWKHDPFGAVVENNVLWGRGALDTKSTGILQLMAMVLLQRQKVPLGRDLLLLACADEENGGKWGAKWMLEQQSDRLNAGYVIDEGGFGFRDVFTYDGQVVYACAVDEKKIFGLKVTARGQSGHGSIPNSDNPNDILMGAIRRLEQTLIRTETPLHPAVRELEARLPDIRRTPYANALKNNSMAITTLRSGTGVDDDMNRIPATAEAIIDCRLLPGVAEYDLLYRMKQAVNDDRVTIEVIRRTQTQAVYMGYRTPLFEALEKSVKRNHASAMVVPILLPMSSDSRFFRDKNMVCCGLNPLELTEEESMLMHALDERLPLARLEPALKIMYDWVRLFCQPTAKAKKTRPRKQGRGS